MKLTLPRADRIRNHEHVTHHVSRLASTINSPYTPTDSTIARVINHIAICGPSGSNNWPISQGKDHDAEAAADQEPGGDAAGGGHQCAGERDRRREEGTHSKPEDKRASPQDRQGVAAQQDNHQANQTDQDIAQQELCRAESGSERDGHQPTQGQCAPEGGRQVSRGRDAADAELQCVCVDPATVARLSGDKQEQQQRNQKDGPRSGCTQPLLLVRRGGRGLGVRPTQMTAGSISSARTRYAQVIPPLRRMAWATTIGAIKAPTP